MSGLSEAELRELLDGHKQPGESERSRIARVATEIVAARVASVAAEAWDKGRAVGGADDPRVRAEPNPYRAVLAAAHDEGGEQR